MPEIPTRLRYGLPLLVAAAIGGAYYFDFLGEESTAILFACTVCLVTSGFVLYGLSASTATPRQGFAVVVASLAVLACSLAPALLAIEPGEALASGELRHSGDSLELPVGTTGHVRLWVHGRIGAGGPTSVRFEIDGGEEPIRGALTRSTRTARAGRRGHMKVVDEHNSMFLTGVIPSGSERLSLTELRGPLSGTLHLMVFRDYLPIGWELGLAAILLLAVAALAARLETKIAPVAIAGWALLFGIMVDDMATPDVAVRPEIGALIIGALAGSTAGAIAFWLARKLVPVGVARVTHGVARD